MPNAYRSPRRAQQAAQTRAEVLAAARVLFAERGWVGTGMRDIAAAAGVSVETVYATMGNKVVLLMAALEGGVVGDDEPVPLADRPAFRALGQGTPGERAAAAAALITDIHLRTVWLHLALRQGAAAEPALAELLAQQERNRRTSTRHGMELALDRPVDDGEVDLFWAQTCVEVFHALVHGSEWPAQRYAAWVVRLVEDLRSGRGPIEEGTGMGNNGSLR